MSPKHADLAVRTALVEAAAGMLRHDQPLTARKLATEVGTSTMAVYTHFGGMEELRRAVRREAFTRLGDHLARVQLTRDPVADLCTLGWAYCVNALENPELYRVMFMEAPIDAEDADVGLATFEPLLEALRRGIDAGRFDDADLRILAVQLWAMIHGLVSLLLASALTIEEMIATIPEMARNLFAGFGDSTDAAQRSIRSAVERMQLPS